MTIQYILESSSISLSVHYAYVLFFSSCGESVLLIGPPWNKQYFCWSWIFLFLNSLIFRILVSLAYLRVSSTKCIEFNVGLQLGFKVFTFGKNLLNWFWQIFTNNVTVTIQIAICFCHLARELFEEKQLKYHCPQTPRKCKQ